MKIDEVKIGELNYYSTQQKPYFHLIQNKQNSLSSRVYILKINLTTNEVGLEGIIIELDNHATKVQNYKNICYLALSQVFFWKKAINNTSLRVVEAFFASPKNYTHFISISQFFIVHLPLIPKKRKVALWKDILFFRKRKRFSDITLYWKSPISQTKK